MVRQECSEVRYILNGRRISRNVFGGNCTTTIAYNGGWGIQPFYGVRDVVKERCPFGHPQSPYPIARCEKTCYSRCQNFNGDYVSSYRRDSHPQW